MFLIGVSPASSAVSLLATDGVDGPKRLAQLKLYQSQGSFDSEAFWLVSVEAQESSMCPISLLIGTDSRATNCSDRGSHFPHWK